MNSLALTQTDLNKLYASGLLHRPAVQSATERTRKEYTFRPEIKARHLGEEERRRRQIEAKRKKYAANKAMGLTTHGLVRKTIHAKNKNAINALMAGLVPYLTYEDRNGRTGLYMAARRMGAKLLFKNGKCTLDNASAKAHTRAEG